MGIGIGGDPSSTSTTALSVLGARTGTGSSDGWKEYIYVLADEAIGAEDVVVIESDYGCQLLDPTASTPGTFQGARVGVAEVAIASGSYGWVQIYGKCTFSAITSNNAYTRLGTSATSGALDDGATTGDEYVEGIIGTAAESGGSQAGELNYPYIGATVA